MSHNTLDRQSTLVIVVSAPQCNLSLDANCYFRIQPARPGLWHHSSTITHYATVHPPATIYIDWLLIFVVVIHVYKGVYCTTLTTLFLFFIFQMLGGGSLLFLWPSQLLNNKISSFTTSMNLLLYHLYLRPSNSIINNLWSNPIAPPNIFDMSLYLWTANDLSCSFLTL